MTLNEIYDILRYREVNVERIESYLLIRGKGFFPLENITDNEINLDEIYFINDIADLETLYIKIKLSTSDIVVTNVKDHSCYTTIMYNYNCQSTYTEYRKCKLKT
jgi:hypothetical protein